MSPIVAYGLRLALPVVGEALMALVRSIEQQGMRPDDAAATAGDIVESIARAFPDWSEGARRAHAIGRIRAHLTRDGRAPDAATVEGLYGLAVQRLRQPAGAAPAQPPAR